MFGMLWCFLLTQNTPTGTNMNMQCALLTIPILSGMEIPVPVVNTLLLIEGKVRSHKHLPLYILLTHINARLKNERSLTSVKRSWQILQQLTLSLLCNYFPLFFSKLLPVLTDK